jgi:hypothetical protein
MNSLMMKVLSLILGFVFNNDVFGKQTEAREMKEEEIYSQSSYTFHLRSI